MGTGNEAKVRPGEELRIDSATWNDMIDMLRWYKRNLGNLGGKSWSQFTNPVLTCLISNETGLDFEDCYQVVRLQDMTYEPDDRTKFAFGKRPVVNGYIPSSSADHIAIVQQPISGGAGAFEGSGDSGGPVVSKIATAVFRGMSLVRLKVNSPIHLFAVPVAGQTGYMESAGSGVAKIIDFMVEPFGSGEGPDSGDSGSGSGTSEPLKLALVDLINGLGGSGGGTGPGTVTGGCGLAGLKPTDCIKFSNSFDGSTHYGTNTGSGVWTSDTALSYPGGSGVAVLTKITGGWTLTVNGIAMDSCGTGCWMGGPATGHASASGGIGCDGETFEVCAECACCELEGWDGEGWYCVRAAGTDENCEPQPLFEGDQYDCEIELCSGPYATEAEANEACGPVTTTCCPDDPWTQNLQIIFASDGTGHLASFNGLTIPLDWTGPTFQWHGNVSPPIVWGLDGVDKLRFACGGEPPLFIADGIQSGVPIVRMIAMESGAAGSLTKDCATNTASGVMAGVSPITGTISFILAPV